MVKTCPICGKEFATVCPNKKYCSPTCSYKANRAIDKEYYKRNRERICERQRTYYAGLPWPTLTPLKVVSCQHCGKMFKETFRHDHFCSDECRLNFYGPLKINAIALVCGKLLD